MTREEILSIDPYSAVLSDEDVSTGIELYKDDADSDALYVREYSGFLGNIVNAYGHRYYHEIHMLNQRYLRNLEAQKTPDKMFVGFLYIKEAEYFQNFNAYAECLRNVNKAIELEDELPLHFLASALNIAVSALWSCDLYEDSAKYMAKMEALLMKEDLIPTLGFTMGCNLMNANAILGNRDKSDYYYDFVKKYSAEEVGINFYCFLEIFKLSDEARFNAGKIPSDEYIGRLREQLKYVYPGNGIEEDYFQIFLPIFRYVRGFVKDSELIELAVKIIDTTYSLPDKINIYKFMFEEFGMTKESEPRLYARFYETLESHYEMISDSRKHEITNEILNEELAEKYKKNAGTDALTGLGNRYSYEAKVNEISMLSVFPDDLYIIMMDLNGLKGVNDNFGHDAGDEFIKAAGNCIVAAFESAGKVYRIGGDEFMAIVNTTPEKMEEMLKRLDENAAAWHGKHNSQLTISTGYSETRDVMAIVQETNRERIDKMAKIADRRMYEAKKAYYERTGKDRRR